MKQQAFHENLTRDERPTGSSDRAFGLTVGGVCVLIGLGVWWLGRTTAWWWLAGGGALMAVALARPAALAPLNRAWTRLGLALFHVVNPVVMAILYYACIVPMGLLMRLGGRDPLKLRRDPSARTYWEPRQPASPLSRGMKDQF